MTASATAIRPNSLVLPSNREPLFGPMMETLTSGSAWRLVAAPTKKTCSNVGLDAWEEARDEAVVPKLKTTMQSMQAAVFIALHASCLDGSAGFDTICFPASRRPV